MNRGVITTLRDMTPIRPLARIEAVQIAERQATRFLELSSVIRPPVDEALISSLPRFDVKRISPFPSSGAGRWVRGQWVVVLNGSEPRQRQRFSRAHELKHILDHPFAKQLYGAIDPGERNQWVESLCDFFAGALLVPRPWLKRAFYSGDNSLASLSKEFDVSQAAIATRLNQIGLGRPALRCGTERRTGTDQLFDSYQRSPWVPLQPTGTNPREG